MRRGREPIVDLQSRDIGVYGLLNFVSGDLVLDMGNERLGYFTPGVDDATTLGAGAGGTAIKIVGPHVEVPIAIDNRSTISALFDSGLSPFPLWTTFAIWRQLTGHDGPDANTTEYILHGKNGELRFIGAPIIHRLSIGTEQLKPTEVVYLASGPTAAAIENWPGTIQAVVEPAALTSDGWIILDFVHSHLSLVRHRQADR
jgi:hypothetical protein